MMSAGLRAGGIIEAPSTRLNGAHISLDFLRQKYWVGNVCYRDLLKIPGVSFTRAATRYAKGRDGVVRLFSSGQPAITDQGLMISRGTGTNRALYSRDWTNAAWTASNVTTALNATGEDGGASSATTLTSTAGNGTVLQTPSGGTSAGFSVSIKRVTGTGNIDITNNGGTNWTTISGLSTTAFVRGFTATGGASSAGIGIRIVTSGDAVIVDFAVASSSFSTITMPESPTTGSTVTGAADSFTVPFVRNGTPLSIHISAAEQEAGIGSLLGYVGLTQADNDVAFVRADVVRARSGGSLVYNTAWTGYSSPTNNSSAASISATEQFGSYDGAASLSTTTAITLPGSTTVAGHGDTSNVSTGGTFYRSMAFWFYDIGYGGVRNATLKLHKARAF
jgi:hypothetical protein